MIMPSVDDDIIQDFLWVDSCAKLSDKVRVFFAFHAHVCLLVFNPFLSPMQYLLAMVYVYFTRASLCVEEYTRINFFIAL